MHAGTTPSGQRPQISETAAKALATTMALAGAPSPERGAAQKAARKVSNAIATKAVAAGLSPARAKKLKEVTAKIVQEEAAKVAAKAGSGSAAAVCPGFEGAIKLRGRDRLGEWCNTEHSRRANKAECEKYYVWIPGLDRWKMCKHHRGACKASGAQCTADCPVLGACKKYTPTGGIVGEGMAPNHIPTHMPIPFLEICLHM